MESYKIILKSFKNIDKNHDSAEGKATEINLETENEKWNLRSQH